MWFNLRQPSPTWVTEKTNALYEDYYKNVVRFDRSGASNEEIEQDFNALLETMRRDLPTTIRVTSSAPFEPLMNEKLAQFFRPRMAEAAAASGEEGYAFDRIPWCVALAPEILGPNLKKRFWAGTLVVTLGS